MSKINTRMNKGDIYETPEYLTNDLLNKEKLEGSVLEPCCASGQMSKVLERFGYNVRSFDIRTDNIYGEGGVDFLSVTEVYDNIVTNPPYSNAQEIIEHALKHSKSKVIMLLKLDWLASKRRKKFFEENTPKKIYVISNRPTLYRSDKEKPKNKGQIEYAWFIWDKSYNGKCTIEWI